MRYVVCSIRDRAADVFGQPVFGAAVGVIARGFADELNRADSPIGKHAEDYDLFLLGSFDDSTGQFENEDHPRQVAIGKDLKVPA